MATVAILAAFVSAILVAAYLLFARAYLQYESEQALLCLARSQPAFVCKRELYTRLRGALPWGGLVRYDLYARGEDVWQTEVEWRWNGCRLRIRKHLSVRRIVGSRS